MADPRANAADARDQLRAFEIAIKDAIRAGQRALVKQAKIEHVRLFEDFELQRYANRAGAVVALGSISMRWRRRKLRLNADPRRGHFSGGIAKTIRSKKSLVTLDDGSGVVLDLKRPNLTTRVPTRLARSKSGAVKTRKRDELRSVSTLGQVLLAAGTAKTKSARRRVNGYIDFYERSKAPGLGSFSKAALGRMQAAANKAINDRISKIVKASRKAGSVRVVEVQLAISRLVA